MAAAVGVATLSERFPAPQRDTLPAFTTEGILPVGDYAPSRAQFEMRFVETAGSISRQRIYKGWNRHRTELMAAGLRADARQLLDGSYTTSKPSPGDVDIAVEVPLTGVEYARLSSTHSPIIALLQGPRMKAEFDCDAYPILVLPDDHPDYQSVTARAVAYWLKWFGTTRDGRTKGRVWARTGGLS